MKGRRFYHKSANQSHDNEEEKEEDCLSSPLCPLCGCVFHLPLLLPCAHTLCGRCLMQKARLDRHRPALETASQRSPTIPQRSPTISQRSPTISQRSPTIPQRSPTISQMSPTISQRSPTIPQRSPTISQRSPTISQMSPTISQMSPTISQMSPTISQRSPTISQRSPTISQRSPTIPQRSPTICTVLCPSCCHSIELPCSDWSTATACLPLDPTVTFDSGCDAQQEDENEEGIRKKTPVPLVGEDVDLSEEEMERSVSGLQFALDSSSIAPPLQVTDSALMVTFRDSGSQVRACDLCVPLPLVYADVEILRGQYYWEVDVCNSALYRIGVRSLAGSDEAWWFERRGSGFHAVFDGRHELLPSVPPQLKTVGVFLNVGGASLTFHNPLTEELLATIPSIFTPPLSPAFQLGQGRLKLRPGLPPPNHVFLSRHSAYRGPEGAGRGRWRRDVAFGSVKAVIQKFEEMVASNSDSSLTSSCSSTLTSTPDPSPETSTHHPVQEH